MKYSGLDKNELFNIDTCYDNYNSINGTYCGRFDRISRSEYNTEGTERNRTDDNSIDNNTLIYTNIFRFKFSEDFTNELYKFSKIHQYDHRKVFKEAWNDWVKDNEDLVNTEVQRLNNIGYEGDILDKMFKSARYYFRKKDTTQKKPKNRRVYVGVQKELLDAMDSHILNNIKNTDYKPSDGFLNFCKNNMSLLQTEVASLLNSGITDAKEVQDKIKKTYKNRYFMVINK